MKTEKRAKAVKCFLCNGNGYISHSTGNAQANTATLFKQFGKKMILLVITTTMKNIIVSISSDVSDN